MKMGKGVLNKIVIIGLVIIALSFTAGLASSGFNFAEAAGGWKPVVDALLAQITGLADRTSDLEDEVFCSGNGTYDSGAGTCACDEGFSDDDCSGTGSVCGNGIVEGGETCDDSNTTSGDGCSSTCQTEGGECAGEDAGTLCGDPTNNSCTNPDTCDGAGNCLDNHEGSTTACSDGDLCTLVDFCDGNGSCLDSGFEADGTPCGGALAEPICNPDVCTAGVCTDVAPASGGTACTDDFTFCNGAEVCDGAGSCTSTGDPCDGADGDADCSEICDEGANECTGNDPVDSVCDGGTCDGAGVCELTDCGPLADPVNGVVDDDPSTLFSIATYACNSGFVLNGDSTRTCQANGIWSGTAPTCTIIP